MSRTAPIRVALLLGALLSSAAWAQAPRSFAAISLIGDKLTAVQEQITTGSRLDRNQHTDIKMPDNLFDRAVLGEVTAAARTANPQAKAVDALEIDAPALFVDQDRLFDGKRTRLPAAVLAAVREGGSSHLLLITKYRGPARLQLQTDKVGTGYLTGLGFYVDGNRRVQDTQSLEAATGYLGPYVYVNLTLIDVRDEAVIAQRTVMGSSAFASTPSAGTSGHPWDALSPQRKVEALVALLQKELRRELPGLLAAQ
jgi:hypothetical protein